VLVCRAGLRSNRKRDALSPGVGTSNELQAYSRSGGIETATTTLTKDTRTTPTTANKCLLNRSLNKMPGITQRGVSTATTTGSKIALPKLLFCIGMNNHGK
jgi:hypothetical protein